MHSGDTPVTREHGRSTWRWAGAAVLVAFALACTPSPGQTEAASPDAPPEQATSPAPTIHHLQPVTNSIGGLPPRFEWTPVEGADRYVIGLWNEVDRLLWRQDDIRTSSIVRPEELDLEAGTYFWRVAAIREGREVADSGWSAFIVRR